MKFGQILDWLFIFVIGSLIVSFILNPGSFNKFTNNVGDVISNIAPEKQISNSSNINIDTISNSQVQDTSLTSCQTEIKEQSRMAKEKSVINLDINIREYKKFNDTLSAIEYLRDWGLIPSKVTGVNYYPELFENNVGGGLVYVDLDKEGDRQYIIQHNDLIVFLIRFDYNNYNYDGETFGELRPIFCIDGKLSKNF